MTLFYWFVASLVAWITCGTIAYGLTFAYFQRKYLVIAEASVSEDRAFACLMAVLGPVGLLIALRCNERCGYGFTFRAQRSVTR
jgi:hypothetical protein